METTQMSTNRWMDGEDKCITIQPIQKNEILPSAAT